MPSGLPTAPDTEIGFQPPPTPARTPPDENSKSLIGLTPFPIAGDGPLPIIFHPHISILTGWLEVLKPGALGDAVKEARTKIPEFMDKLHITDAFSFLDFANDLLKWTPEEEYKAKDIYDIITMFYFILDQKPLAELQTQIHPSQAGMPLTWLSSWIVIYAQLIGLFMDTPASITEKSLESFKNSPPYAYHEAEVPPGGFRTFNEFFARKLKPGMRPIADPEDDHVIVYPADCTFDRSIPKDSIINIESDGIVMIKGLEWTISSLLQGSKYAKDFHGGVWMHAFLNTFNYHRQHAPVSGEVVEVKNIQGAAYLEVNAKCERVRKMCGTDAPDSPGYQFLQTRGLCVIDNPVLGLVAVLPIGMAQVSSVKMTAQVGDKLKKGDEISYFQFGGSDVICVFQPKAGLKVDDFVASPDDTYSRYGTVLARAPKK
ncbi:phosphatidylserine decarboxylase-domain-containing protein [Fusarium flagelliforme]|uniref:phosphatidylserine decarboxylase-domain-containing protein n=1 Tax=Fusarium flagelliforme TaxID=2675880 RepID=UPI001E8EAA4A|nr:phosphatidylserine decarboxylase-domain-containing protein [Fusarium flagelliforme]KAH7174915.1 phosphatidylserine decarboxylase-domain-containing protein [Fusarium flagelliforme]